MRTPFSTPRWSGPLLLGALSLVLSVALIREHPTMFWYDGYSRLFERRHIIVDRWLPLVQTVVFTASKLTTDVTASRLVFAAIAAGTVTSAAVFGARLFAYSTGIIFAALLATNALFAALAIVPYQEVPFLGIAFVGLVFHERRASARSRWAARVCFNALCLTRYEGWVLVALLAARETFSEVRRTRFATALRGGIVLGAEYGATAVAWLVVLAARPHLSRPWQLGPNSAHPVRHLAIYLYRTAWELGGCPARNHPWVGALLAVVLALLAFLGLLHSLRHAPMQPLHWTIGAWVFSAMSLVILVDPYFDDANLRQPFLPVVFTLLYAAEGLRLAVESAAARLTRASNGAQSNAAMTATAAVAGLFATISAHGARRFVAASSAEPDFRVPAAVGRELAQSARVEENPRVVTLLDRAMDRGIIALYAGLPSTSVEPLVGALPPRTTHVVLVYAAGEPLSGSAAALERRLESGALPADVIRSDAAVIWKLR